MQGKYERWGFSHNPFTQHALQADETGSKLLVGREKEVDAVIARLADPPKVVTVEGDNGVGKTSIINVATYNAMRDFFAGNTDLLYFPASPILQITSERYLEDFLDDIYFSVAQALLSIATNPRVERRFSGIRYRTAVDKWLNKPEVQGWSAGLSLASGGRTPFQNTTAGFTRDGFRRLVREWLEDMFPDGNRGGVVCIIDNLEILQTSKAARDQLESLRDPALAIPGIRWVFCGAAGIVRSVASSPRLEGYLYSPIEVSGIDSAWAQQVLQSRIDVFRKSDDYFLPIDSKSFEKLSSILNGNVRNALSYADNYCQWVTDQDREDAAKANAPEVFVEWIRQEYERVTEEVSKQVKARAWQVFDIAVGMDGVFAPGDYSKFGCNSSQALRGLLVALERANLIESSIDEDDNRRRTISVTPRGWMVYHARQEGFETLFASDSGGEGEGEIVE